MNRAAEFLKNSGTFCLATAEGDQPRVRPFGAVMEYEGKTYLCTKDTKECFKQMVQNPKVEISSMYQGEWIRICGEAVPDARREVKKAMLDSMPSLRKMYSEDDGIYEVLYLTKAKATIYSYTKEPEIFDL